MTLCESRCGPAHRVLHLFPRTVAWRSAGPKVARKLVRNALRLSAGCAPEDRDQAFRDNNWNEDDRRDEHAVRQRLGPSSAR